MDRIKLVNLALTRLGAATVERLDEPSEQARVVNRVYDAVRQDLLRQYDWGFARRSVSLAEVQSDSGEYRFAYRVPADCLTVRRLRDENFIFLPRDNRFKIVGDERGRLILTDVAAARLEYTADVQDEGLFDAEFSQAMSWKLAADVAMALTGRPDLVQLMQSGFERYMLEAQWNDANEDNVEDPKLDRLAAARFEGV